MVSVNGVYTQRGRVHGASGSIPPPSASFRTYHFLAAAFKAFLAHSASFMPLACATFSSRAYSSGLYRTCKVLVRASPSGNDGLPGFASSFPLLLFCFINYCRPNCFLCGVNGRKF